MPDLTNLLADIRAREEAATEGPWTAELHDLTQWVFSEDQTLEAKLGYVGNRPEANANFIAHARTDVPRLLGALEGVLALHKPVTYWMTHEDADISYQTKQDALEERTDLTEADLVPFELCTHCKTIEDSPCEGECTMEAGYRESLYPCLTVAAVVAALGEEA